MGEKRNIRNSQNELNKIKHHISWDSLEVNKVYHIPPVLTIERMDVLITEKSDDNIKFKIISGTNKEEVKSMHKTSILSRFLVNKRKY